jgi:hypothetical protein
MPFCTWQLIETQFLWCAPKSRQEFSQHWKNRVENDEDFVGNSVVIVKYVRIIHVNFVIEITFSEQEGIGGITFVPLL